ncbi:hypothetical protein [Saccharothrix xinjiangensis]|uniref:Uncharacterized protein n=1 Tax=Saccharothrix xinjiangensis TaxID=204798 RepID=A0ABV9Y3V0_9PSEU
MARSAAPAGLRASGKSTSFARHLAPTHLHVSKDHRPNGRRWEAREEGFDELHVVTFDGTGGFTVTPPDVTGP